MDPLLLVRRPHQALDNRTPMDVYRGLSRGAKGGGMNGSQGGAWARLRLAPAGRPTGTIDRQRHTHSHAGDRSKDAKLAALDAKIGGLKSCPDDGAHLLHPDHQTPSSAMRWR